ncbi:MAG: EAL domain-containing protein [Burkholderiaceae bacterium]
MTPPASDQALRGSAEKRPGRPRAAASAERGASGWHWPTVSIRAAVVMAIVAGVVLPGLAMLWVDARVARDQIEPLVRHRRDNLLGLTATALTEPLRRGQAEQLQGLQRALLQDPLVCGLELRQADGSPALPAQACSASSPTDWREVPLLADGRPLGTLRLGFDDRAMQQLESGRRAALLRLVGVQIVLGAAVLIWVLNWRLLRPIDRLKRQALALARPDAAGAGGRKRWQRRDELGELGQHLNVAHERIAQLVDELEGRHAELRRLAMVDQLTGLPNRRLFRELFDHALAVARRAQQPMALMFIDLDRFKHINDSLGHPAGDELLRQLGQRLRAAMRGSDVVGRLSGDEFIALLPDAAEPEAIAHAALRVIHAIEMPVPLPGREVQMQVSASVGVARYPGDGQGFDELLRHADQAMYRAKAAGRGRYALFREAERPDAALAGSGAELALALQRRELQLHYQPVIDTRSGTAVGSEALLRWQHPSQGLLPPARFIHRAEECGQIHALGQHALRSACGQLAQWKAAGLHTGSVAVNLSTGEFRHEQLPRLVAQALDAHGLAPGELELELSSHTAMSDAEFTQARADELRALGAALVLDDVGSSMLSLDRLCQLRPAKLKIDAALVGRLPQDAQALATVRAIVQLGHSLGIGVVATGVETEAQRDALAQAGCAWQQGFLFARPAPASNEPQWARPAAPGARGADQRLAGPAEASASSRSRAH